LPSQVYYCLLVFRERCARAFIYVVTCDEIVRPFYLNIIDVFFSDWLDGADF